MKRGAPRRLAGSPRDTPVAPWAWPGRAVLAACAAFAACAPQAPPEAAGLGAVEADPDSEAEAVDPAPAADVHGPLEWIASEEEATTRGRAERRPVLVHFGTEWCVDCKRMASETFQDPQFVTQAGRFIAVRIDATNDEDPKVSAALSKYAVVNVPTLVVLDSRGRERRRFTDFVPPATLLGEIRQIR